MRSTLSGGLLSKLFLDSKILDGSVRVKRSYAPLISSAQIIL